MNSIIAFLFILSIVIFISIIFTDGLKGNIKIIGVIALFLIVTSIYYYIPVDTELFSNPKLYGKLEFRSVSDANDHYLLTEKDNDELLNQLKHIKMRRFDSESRYISNNVHRIVFKERGNHRTYYMLKVDYSAGIGRLSGSANDQSYSFKVDDSLVEYIDNLFKEYKEIATEKSPPIDIPYNLEEHETSQDHREFYLEIPIRDNDIIISESYLFYRYNTGSSKKIFDASVIDQGKYTLEFTVNTNRDNRDRRVRDVKLYVRGEKMFNGDYKKFQQVIEIK